MNIQIRIILITMLLTSFFVFLILLTLGRTQYQQQLDTNLKNHPEIGISGSYNRIDPITFQSYSFNPDQTPETADNTSNLALLNANTITNDIFTNNLGNIQSTITNKVKKTQPTAKATRIAPDSLQVNSNNLSFLIIVDSPNYQEYLVSVDQNGSTKVSEKL